MRKSDMFHMCLQNLTRRKSRTILTVLGVMIGCCAIVIMVSLGFGTQEAQDKMLSQMGDLTMIQIYNYNQSSENKLNEEMINNFRSVSGVAAATGKLNIGNYYSPSCSAGANKRYITYWMEMCGVSLDSFYDMGYELIEGNLPEKEGEVVVGQYFAYNFYDTLKPNGRNYVNRWEGGYDEEGNLINVPDPFFDVLGETIKVEYQLNNGTVIKSDLKVVGVMKENYNVGYETSEGVLMDVGAMTAQINQLFIKDGVKKDITYQEAYVKCDSINSVAQAQKDLETYGFDTWSMESIREPLQEEARQKQIMLGGLGAISLLVAAIGIANTMIMSISERTREIGIMKALGCFVGDIRFMFLTEAGLIGLTGGIIATIVSLIAMIVINTISLGMGFNAEVLKICFSGSETVSRTSVIPWWLAVFGLIFSIVIGLVSGYAPANKAVKVSALEAIKSSE